MDFFKASSEMEAYASTLGPHTYLFTDWSICPHNALAAHLKLVPGFLAYFFIWVKVLKVIIVSSYH